jgi:Uma2 family endonuclease
MTATAPRISIQPGQRIITHGVSWSTYEGLLADHFGRVSPRFTYDRGLLEIMVTSLEHEVLNRRCSSLVEIVAEELQIELDNLGQATFKRDDLAQGFEPDTCFFIQHRPTIRNTIFFDPATDAPPDLVLEIDINNDALSRFPIYAGFGVPEVWRYIGGRIGIWRFELGSYVESEISGVLPLLTADVITRFLAQSREGSWLAWVRSVRSWVREQLAGQSGR